MAITAANAGGRDSEVDDGTNGNNDEPIVILSVRERDGEYSGGLETILEQFDRRTALGVEFNSNIGELEQISLEIGGHPRNPEVVLTVRSTDAAVGRSVFARMSDEVERGVPWWSRGPLWFRMAVGIAVLVTVFGCAAGLRVSSERNVSFDWDAAYQMFYPAALLSLLFIRPAVSRPPASWFFPKFEVSGDGVSTTSRRIVGMLGLLFTIPIGVLVNYIS